MLTPRPHHHHHYQVHGALVITTLTKLIKEHMDDSDYVGVGLEILQVLTSYKPPVESSGAQQQEHQVVIS